MTPPDSSLAALPVAEIATAQNGELVPFTTGKFSIPADDLGDFMKLSDAERERILLLLSCFPLMDGDVVAQSHSIARRLSHIRGYSAANLRTLYYAFQSGGVSGWRSLVRGYKGPQEVPDEFKAWFQSECLKNHRSIRAQIGIVKRLWQAGESVPGYGTWKEWFVSKAPERDLPRACPGVPRGWSESNLYTIQPPKAERALKTQGYAAAKAYLPSIIRDTSKLRPMELIVIDDFEIDQRCVYNGHICKVAGLLAMDVATRRRLALGLKPREQREDGTMQAILRHEVRYMLYSMIAEWGLPTEYPITILCENASAAIESELEKAFQFLFAGRIRVTRTGLIDCRVMSNGFVQKGGKPWEKGWVESLFNAAWNLAAVLPGQKGASYQQKPAELAAKLVYAERLLSQGPRGLNLSEEQIAQLQMPFLGRDQLLSAYHIIFDLLEARTNHKMIGFDSVQEWRRDECEVWQPWEKLALVPAGEQLGIVVQDRPESPAERWQKLNERHPRAKIADHVLAALLLTPKEATLRNGRITFTHGGKGYTFADRAAYVLNEREGERVRCFFDENNADCVHVFRINGAFIQTIQRLGPVDITNPEAIRETIATVKAIENQAFASVRERTLAQAQEIAGMVAHNERVSPGLHADSTLRRALGFKSDDAKQIAAPSVTKTLADARKAGPMKSEDFSGAACVSGAALQKAEHKQKASVLRAADELDSSHLI